MGQPYSAYANLSLAGYYHKRKDKDRAVAYLNRIPNDSFALADKFALLGDFSAKSGDIDAAVAYFRKSLEVNSGHRENRVKLVRLLRRSDRKAYEKEKRMLEEILEYYKGF